MSRVAQRIREEAAAAEKQLLELASSNSEQPAEGTPIEGQDEDQPVQVHAQEDQPAQPPVQQPPVQQPVQPQVSALEREYAELKHKYDTLQGMFAKQGADTKALQQQLEELSKQLAQQRESPASVPVEARVTKKDREEYGDELIDLIRRAALDAIGTHFAAIRARLDRLEKSLDDVGTKATTAAKTSEEIAAERFYSELTRAVPDWEAINSSQEWLTWLGERDLITGVRRDALLQDAHAHLDTKRVAAIFMAFKRDTGKLDTASGGAKSGGARIDPKTLVSPSSAASPQPTGQPNQKKGKVWTEREIAQVYDDYAKGKITKAAFKQLESDIYTALADGRVTS